MHHRLLAVLVVALFAGADGRSVCEKLLPATRNQLADIVNAQQRYLSNVLSLDNPGWTPIDFDHSSPALPLFSSGTMVVAPAVDPRRRMGPLEESLASRYFCPTSGSDVERFFQMGQTFVDDQAPIGSTTSPSFSNLRVALWGLLEYNGYLFLDFVKEQPADGGSSMDKDSSMLSEAQKLRQWTWSVNEMDVQMSTDAGFFLGPSTPKKTPMLMLYSMMTLGARSIPTGVGSVRSKIEQTVREAVSTRHGLFTPFVSVAMGEVILDLNRAFSTYSGFGTRYLPFTRVSKAASKKMFLFAEVVEAYRQYVHELKSLFGTDEEDGRGREEERPMGTAMNEEEAMEGDMGEAGDDEDGTVERMDGEAMEEQAAVEDDKEPVAADEDTTQEAHHDTDPSSSFSPFSTASTTQDRKIRLLALLANLAYKEAKYVAYLAYHQLLTANVRASMLDPFHFAGESKFHAKHSRFMKTMAFYGRLLIKAGRDAFLSASKESGFDYMEQLAVVPHRQAGKKPWWTFGMGPRYGTTFPWFTPKIDMDASKVYRRYSLRHFPSIFSTESEFSNAGTKQTFAAYHEANGGRPAARAFSGASYSSAQSSMLDEERLAELEVEEAEEQPQEE